MNGARYHRSNDATVRDTALGAVSGGTGVCVLCQSVESPAPDATESGAADRGCVDEGASAAAGCGGGLAAISQRGCWRGIRDSDQLLSNAVGAAARELAGMHHGV